MDDEEREELIAWLALNPEAGAVMPGTGGVRKLRWGLAGRGKRGGARVIYYFHNEQVPVFLLSAYARQNEKANLSMAQRNEMKTLIPGADSGILQKGLTAMATKTVKRAAVRKSTPAGRSAVGESILEGLRQAVAWAEGKNTEVRVTIPRAPEVDVRAVRRGMGLSQAEFATRFGLPPATLRNWEQGRSRPDAPTRVLLAVIARHPEVVEEVLGRAS